MTTEPVGQGDSRSEVTSREQAIRDYIDKIATKSVPSAPESSSEKKPETVEPSRETGLLNRLKERGKNETANYVGKEHSIEDYASRLEKLRFEDHEFDAKLKKSLGTTVICLLILQVALMNIAFGVYGFVEVFHRHHSLPETVVIAWLTSSIVQVVGLATVVAKYLFPGEGNNWANEPD